MYNWWQIHLSLHKLFLVISIFFKRYLLFCLTRKKNFVIRLEFHKPKSKHFSIYFSIETQSVTYRRKDYRSYLPYLTQFTSYVTWNRFGRRISWKDLAMERVEENGSGKNDGGRANGECSMRMMQYNTSRSLFLHLYFPHYYFFPLSRKLSPTITLFQWDSQLELNIVFVVNSAWILIRLHIIA